MSNITKNEKEEQSSLPQKKTFENNYIILNYLFTVISSIICRLLQLIEILNNMIFDIFKVEHSTIDQFLDEMTMGSDERTQSPSLKVSID